MILWLALGASSAVAQELSVYVGAGVGELDHDNEAGGAFSDAVSSWKIYGGFQAGQYFSIEFARGKASAIEVGAPGSLLSVATLRFQAAHSVDFGLSTFRAMGRLPVKRMDLWMGYGSYQMDADVDFTSSFGAPSSISVDDAGELLAMGVDWNFGTLGQPLRVRLEYERLYFPFSDASTVAVGVAYRFRDL